MARIFRHSYTILNEQTGKRELRRTRRWYIEFRDAQGKRKRIPGFTDKIATQRKAAEIEHGVILLLRGERPPANTPTTSQKTIEENLADFEQHLRQKGDTDKHVTLLTKQVKKICLGIFQNLQVPLSDLTRQAVENWLANARKQPNFGLNTSNCYARAARSFSRWAVREGRLQADPLAGMASHNIATDRRHVRRALTPDELGKLIGTVRKSKRVFRLLTGTDRAIFYQLAAYAGLRRREILSLTPAAFRLDAKPPTLTVSAVHAKNRTSATLPLPPWFAAELWKWLAGRVQLWPCTLHFRAAEMLHADLAEAGIPYRDSHGRVCDVHSLRATFVTNLARAGVPLVTAQKLARHSSPVITAQIYSIMDMGDLSEAVAKLTKPV